MNLLEEIFTPQTRSADVLKHVGSGGFFGLFGGKTVGTKANVTTSFTLAAFYCAVNVLSDDIAKLPKPIYQKKGDSRHKADHYVDYLINTRPNGKMTAFTFWKVIEALRIVKGNAFVLITRNSNTGKIKALQLLDNAYVEVLQDNEQLWYKYKGNLYSSDEVLHFLGFTLDGLIGVGVVTYAAASLGLYLDNQEYGATVYKDRGLGYGTLETDKAVTVDNKRAISNAFESRLASGSKFRTPVLDEGFKYKSITLSPAEAQFLETHKNGVTEVAKWLNIAPHKLKDLTNANYSNIYQQSIEHVQDNVQPRTVMYEQELEYKLFTTAERKDHYIKYNLNSLLRGDLQAKAQYYMSLVYSGVYSRNEVRALEELNPVEGLSEHLTPVNMELLDFVLKSNKKELANETTK